MAEIVIPEMKTDFELDEIVMPTHMNNIGKAINTLKAQAIELGQIDIIQTLNNLGNQVNELYAKGGVVDEKIADILESIQGILTELDNKANVDSEQEWFILELLNGFIPNVTPKYSKNSNGRVDIIGSVTRDAIPQTHEQIAQLPVGFRPTNTIPIHITQSSGWATYGVINTDGSIKFGGWPMNQNYQAAPIAFSATSFRTDKML